VDNDLLNTHRPITHVAGSDRLDACGGLKRWVDQCVTHGLEAKPVSIEEAFTLNTMGVCVAVLAPDEPDNVIYQLADRAQTSLMPGVVLLPPEMTQAASVLASEGLVLLPWDADGAQIASSVRALDTRQSLVRKLRDELRIAQLSVNGAYGEMAKLQEEMQTAATIQRAHMPKKMPTIKGADVGVVYRPATYVSGDIYDVAQLDEHRSAFFIADAVGHGVPAALMTMIIACGLNKLDGVGEDARIVPPAEALYRLNNAMTAHSGGSNRFATAVYGVYDARSGEVTIAGAGHPPPIIVRQGGVTVDRVEPEGPLLGVFPDADFGQTTHRLDPGDLLVLFSDGFEVAFPAAGSVGDDFKRPTLTYIDKLSHAGENGVPLNEAVEELERELDNAAGSLHQPDDITALFIAPTGVKAKNAVPSAA